MPTLTLDRSSHAQVDVAMRATVAQRSGTHSPTDRRVRLPAVDRIAADWQVAELERRHSTTPKCHFRPHNQSARKAVKARLFGDMGPTAQGALEITDAARWAVRVNCFSGS